jgi:hypothetical protein
MPNKHGRKGSLIDVKLDGQDEIGCWDFTASGQAPNAVCYEYGNEPSVFVEGDIVVAKMRPFQSLSKVLTAFLS